MSSPAPTDAAPRIAVGVDGSDGSRAALAWAADTAGRWEGVLVPVLIWSYLDQPSGEGFRSDFTEDDAWAYLRSVVAEELGESPSVPVEPRAVVDVPVKGLLAAARDVDLMVVGERGTGGGFAGVRLGSVSSQVVHHAVVPTVVHRPRDGGPHGRILVGIDTSENSRLALTWAAAEAARRGAVLEVVHAWSSPVVAFPPGIAFDPTLITEVEAAARTALDDFVDGALSATGDLQVERTLVEAPAGTSLVERAEQADLIVVGTRGRGGFASLLLGSVSHKVVNHAPCSVAVIPLPPTV